MNGVLQEWIAAINAHDVPALAGLMTEDFLFVDALGDRVQGNTAMEAGWRGYFTMCPDYWIRADRCMEDEGVALFIGEAGGTIDGESWKTPAAWKAVIRGAHISEWRVFADNKPVWEILARRKR